jgi:hypothetical protein
LEGLRIAAEFRKDTFDLSYVPTGNAFGLLAASGYLSASTH